MVRRAGQHARERTRLLAIRALVAIVACVVAWALSFLVFGPSVVTGLAALAVPVAIDRLALPVIDRWDRGATGEEHVGGVLEALADQGVRVLHDVDLGRGNIDHVVVGPAGLFTVETKSHPGRLRAERLNPAMTRQAYAQAKALERIVGQPVTPLLVFSRAFLVPAVSRQRGVVVLPARMLAGHLRRRRARWSAEEVEVLHGRLGSAVGQGGPRVALGSRAA